MRHRSIFATVVASALFLVSCGSGGADSVDAGPSVPLTSTSTATVTVTADPEGPEGSSDEPSDREVTPDPPKPPPPDKDLTTADAFSLGGEWTDDRYNVATLKQIKGMGVPVIGCSSYEEPPSMELRLENGFSKLTLKAGQANTSPSSDQTLKIEIVGDGKQLDIQQMKFNRIQEFDAVAVEGVNALQILIRLDDSVKGCDDGSIEAVLFGMQLS